MDFLLEFLDLDLPGFAVLEFWDAVLFLDMFLFFNTPIFLVVELDLEVALFLFLDVSRSTTEFDVPWTSFIWNFWSPTNKYSLNSTCFIELNEVKKLNKWTFVFQKIFFDSNVSLFSKFKKHLKNYTAINHLLHWKVINNKVLE